MRREKLLHTFLKRKLPTFHKVRLNSLIGAVSTLIVCSRLSLSSLGRNLVNKAKVRSNIKKMDRLLANQHLKKDRVAIYQKLASELLVNRSKVLIHVDWSCICAVTSLYLLRASISFPGPSIVLYEECHPKKNENNHATHKTFLRRLKSVLPKSVCPIIVSDAGFRAPWFSFVRKLGWDFVGRLRNRNLVYLESTGAWHLSSSFFKLAKSSASYLGSGLLTRTSKQAVNLVLYKRKIKNRHKININKKPSRASKSRRYAKSLREPWLLVTSLKASDQIAAKTINIYSTRMQIEENFRDTKCARYGFGLNYSRTRSHARMNILLLIAALASFISLLAGLHVMDSGQALDYQTTSLKKKRALSFVFLGKEALRRNCEFSMRKINSLSKNLLEMAGSNLRATQ